MEFGSHLSAQFASFGKRRRQISPAGDTAQPVPSQTNAGEPWHCRELILPLDLRDPDVAVPYEFIVEHLGSIFPGTTEVLMWRGRSFLVFIVKSLPSQPWPLTIGGLPFYIRLVSDESRIKGVLPTSHDIITVTNPRLCPEQRFTKHDKMPGRELQRFTQELHAYFLEHLPDVRLCELMFASDRFFYAFVDDSTDLSAVHVRRRFPSQIGNLFVAYCHESDLRSSQRQAQRQAVPNCDGAAVDDTAYDILQPGVMIFSTVREGENPIYSNTTAGVLVRGTDGEAYMTAASHGVSDSGVITAPKTGRVLGTAAARDLPHTGVCLATLEDEVLFDNTPDSQPDMASKFMRLVNGDDDMTHSTCFVDTPFAPVLEGVVVYKSVRIQGVGPYKYTIYEWLYMGQPESGRPRPPMGACGAAICSDKGIVVGFYDFYVDTGDFRGFFACVSGVHLADAGFTLGE